MLICLTENSTTLANFPRNNVLEYCLVYEPKNLQNPCIYEDILKWFWSYNCIVLASLSR